MLLPGPLKPPLALLVRLPRPIGAREMQSRLVPLGLEDRVRLLMHLLVPTRRQEAVVAWRRAAALDTVLVAGDYGDAAGVPYRLPVCGGAEDGLFD